VHLGVSAWQARSAAHAERVDSLVAAHLARRRTGVAHPVEDFLFEYYTYRPAHLRRWHPGFGTTLAGDPLHAGWTGYRRTATGVGLEPGFLDRRVATVRFVAGLLSATASRPAFTGCFGLHEWAMVYRSGTGPIRHTGLPLRLGHDGTDAVVESHQIRCSHFDAFRFFTDDARPLNAVQPTRERQAQFEQPGCLHAGMDLYKWAYKLAPLVGSELVVDAFVLARQIRELDMRASPYDLTAYGLAPVRIETREGKAEYVARQREFAERTGALRSRLRAALTPVVADHGTLRNHS
jgi:hypothetical protein